MSANYRFYALHLYRALLHSASSLPTIEARAFARTRMRIEFREHSQVKESNRIEELLHRANAVLNALNSQNEQDA
jgi:5-enolpyruvylshikimate-3-phosphate synthase